LNIWTMTENQWRIFDTIFREREVRLLGEELLADLLVEELSKETERERILKIYGLDGSYKKALVGSS